MFACPNNYSSMWVGKNNKMWGPNGAILLYLCWEERLYSHTDNSSKDIYRIFRVLRWWLLSEWTTPGKCITKETLTKIRTDQSFGHFYVNVPNMSKYREHMGRSLGLKTTSSPGLSLKKWKALGTRLVWKFAIKWKQKSMKHAASCCCPYAHEFSGK